MNWNSVGEFIAMGGYGGYVWGSFGMVALAIGLEIRQLVVAAKTTTGEQA